MNRSLMRHVKLVVFLTGRGISCLQSVVQFKDPQLKRPAIKGLFRKKWNGPLSLNFSGKIKRMFVSLIRLIFENSLNFWWFWQAAKLLFKARLSQHGLKVAKTCSYRVTFVFEENWPWQTRILSSGSRQEGSQLYRKIKGPNFKITKKIGPLRTCIRLFSCTL